MQANIATRQWPVAGGCIPSYPCRNIATIPPQKHSTRTRGTVYLYQVWHLIFVQHKKKKKKKKSPPSSFHGGIHDNQQDKNRRRCACGSLHQPAMIIGKRRTTNTNWRRKEHAIVARLFGDTLVLLRPKAKSSTQRHLYLFYGSLEEVEFQPRTVFVIQQQGTTSRGYSSFRTSPAISGIAYSNETAIYSTRL